MYYVLAVFLSVQLAFISFFGGFITVPQTSAPCETDNENSVVLQMPLEGGNDPWIYEHNGEYYYCYSIGIGVAIRHSSSIEDLLSSPETVAYRAPGGTMYSGEYWAPELHFIDGAWYIYVAADDGRNENHRMYVLKSDDPLGEFELIGKVSDESDRWAIDGTIFEYEGELYFVWSGWEGETDSGQNLYIAHMSDPAHIDSERVLISAPKYKWEKSAAAINEGPSVLQKDGKLYIVYSANASWTDSYCLGMLSFSGGNLLDKRNWAKSPLPVFSQRDTAYGPGHCSFISTDKADYIIYHANVESGSGWDGRTVRIQRFEWICGVPVFGRPLCAGTEVVFE
ncbi:MAG: glycoside hydrolase family 43 protein [Oscillospiraceae bacterium]|nr:glycoside hydrolase family 43 protein [Oscillospiraceae bacterium]